MQNTKISKKQLLNYMKKLDQLEAKRLKIMKKFYDAKTKYEFKKAQAKLKQTN